ncbi:unnamed protein product [Arabis nemorensis]|uniref:Uncharacterized protein n=1 Tax=Arabis nemorensis TaxID=586526 RepID=A0A565BDL3_9BRAS|nr:unnamed protein product [Arabis nemorensis]
MLLRSATWHDLKGKHGIEKQPFHLSDLIAATRIEKTRQRRTKIRYGKDLSYSKFPKEPMQLKTEWCNSDKNNDIVRKL